MALRARPAAARHGDGAVPPDRAVRRARHPHDRHRAGGGPARRRRISAQRRHAPLHGRLRSAARTRDPRRGQPRHLCRDARRPHHPERRRSTSRWAISGPRTSQRSSRAWSSAAPTAASTSPAGWWRWCRRRIISWVASVCSDRHLDRAAGPVRRRRGRERHARRQPARRQRRRQLDRVRRHRRRHHAALDRGQRGPSRARRARARGRDRARAGTVRRQPGDLNGLRERLLDTMWDEVGVVRDRAGLDRALAALDDIEAELVDDRRRRRRPRLQPDLARLAQPALAGRDEPRDRARGAGRARTAAARISARTSRSPASSQTSTFTVARQGRRLEISESRSGSPSCGPARRCSKIKPPQNRREAEHDPDLRAGAHRRPS